MPTLQELVEMDLGAGGVEKQASENSHMTDDPEIRKIADSLGMFGDDGAAEQQEKTAGEKGMDSLYNELFPEDVDLTKEASELEKEAAEEALGERAFDYFADRFDRRIEKLASDTLTGAATISSPVANGAQENPHAESKPGQTLPDNKPADAKEKIDSTKPEYTDEVTKLDDERTVGDYEQKSAMDLAVRKMLLMSQLED
jgi:hypothetical protein